MRDHPDDDGSLNNLAWNLATSRAPALRDGKRAVELAKRACELSSREDPTHLDTLAAAFAEVGNFDAAVKTQLEAIRLISKGDPSEKGYRDRLELYQAKRPYRVEEKHAK